MNQNFIPLFHLMFHPLMIVVGPNVIIDAEELDRRQDVPIKDLTFLDS